MLIIRNRRPYKGEVYRLEAPGMRLSFRTGDLDGRPIFAARVPDDHPCCARLADRFRQRPRDFEVVEGMDEAVRWGASTPMPSITAPSPDGPVTDDTLRSSAEMLWPGCPEVAVAAMRNGWEPEDLIGSGKDNDPGPRGGASPRTGLFLAQMALCAPPPDWAAKADDHWPWEVEGWKPPTLDWKPPALPSKGTPTVDPDAIGDDSTVVDLSIGEPVTPSGEPLPGIEVPDDPDAPRLDPDADADADNDPEAWVGSDDTDDEPAEPEAPATLDELVRRLYSEAGDKVPSLSKVRYWGKKCGLDVTKAKYDDLISQLA